MKLRHAYSKIYHLQPILILTTIPQGKVFMTNKGTEMQKVYFTKTGFSIQALFCISCLSHSEAKESLNHHVGYLVLTPNEGF